MKEIKERRERIYSFISKIMEIERYMLMLVTQKEIR